MKNNNKLKKELKGQKIINISGEKFLIIKLNKIDIDLIPIGGLLGGEVSLSLLPKINVKYEYLSNYESVDDFNMFYLLNEDNSHIQRIVQEYLNERKGSGKN